MVKGISRQVIVVHSPDPGLFEQAIFILHDGARQGISQEAILAEAKKIIRGEEHPASIGLGQKLLWMLCGAGSVGVMWLFSLLL